MRTLKLLVLGVLFIASATPAVHAQTTPAVEPSRFFFNVNLGAQWNDQTFTDSSTYTIYSEQGAVATAHSFGGGTLFDISAAARVWRNAAIGLAYSTVSNKNDATSVVRVPHPVVFGQTRTATATLSDLEHSEEAVHLQFMWMIPLTDKVEIAVMAGPSFFSVKQSVATVRAPEDLTDVPPYTSVTINTMTVTDVKDSPVGVNVGIDGTYMIRTIAGVGVGVGGFLRYAGASLDFEVPPGVTRDTELKAGGPQGALGVRLRF